MKSHIWYTWFNCPISFWNLFKWIFSLWKISATLLRVLDLLSLGRDHSNFSESNRIPSTLPFVTFSKVLSAEGQIGANSMFNSWHVSLYFFEYSSHHPTFLKPQSAHHRPVSWQGCEVCCIQPEQLSSLFLPSISKLQTEVLCLVSQNYLSNHMKPWRRRSSILRGTCL